MLIDATNISFIGADGIDDETQFDIQNDTELALLWWDFCKENGLISVTKGKVDYESGVMV